MAGVPNAGVQRQLAEEKTAAAIKTRIEIFRSFVRCRATAAQPAMYLAPWAGVEPATSLLPYGSEWSDLCLFALQSYSLRWSLRRCMWENSHESSDHLHGVAV